MAASKRGRFACIVRGASIYTYAFMTRRIPPCFTCSCLFHFSPETLYTSSDCMVSIFCRGGSIFMILTEGFLKCYFHSKSKNMYQTAHYPFFFFFVLATFCCQVLQSAIANKNKKTKTKQEKRNEMN